MVDVMQGLVTEAKKNKFSTIGQFEDEDVVSVWDNVSAFVEKNMSNQKGVNIPGLGTFTFSQKKLDVGNNKFILIQRPVFLLSEKFAQTHGLNYTKHHTSGQIPIVQLNFAVLSYESPFDRDTVEACVKEVLQALARSVASKKNVEFTFNGIGRFQIRDSKVKMKFYKEFLNSMDGSGRLVEALKDRPGTVDSVISNRSPSRPFSQNTLVLPKISPSGNGLTLDDSGGDGGAPGGGGRVSAMPAIKEDHEGDTAALLGDIKVLLEENMDGEDLEAPGPCGDEPLAEGGEAPERQDMFDDDDLFKIDELKKSPVVPPSRSGSRIVVPLAKATGISFSDDLLPQNGLKTNRTPSVLSKSSPNPLGRRSLSPINPQPHSANSPRPAPLKELDDTLRSKSADKAYAVNFEEGGNLPPPIPRPPTMEKPESPSGCGHKGAGQELCYLCHQRDRRNIPVSFSEERNRREQEEDRLLQQYQHLKDTEAILDDQEQMLAKRHENQKMAAFNLGVSEAVKSKKYTRPTDFHSSYIFQKRPLTPPRFIKQEKYFSDLQTQVVAKDDKFQKRKADEEFLERLEQVQLAEDLAAQREQYLKDKQDQQDQYKRALSAQITVRDSQNDPGSRPRLCASNRILPLSLPKPTVIVPFAAKTISLSLTSRGGGDGITIEKKISKQLVRFKPLPLPARVPDSTEPVFGKFDMTNESMAAHRRRAHELYKEQLETVEQRKRGAILKRLTEQKEEEAMLHRARQDLLDDRADKFKRLYMARKKLEDDWSKADDHKKEKEQEEKALERIPGMLVQEQCDRYKRCGQCKRRVVNCGESNIWRESRYIPGSRLMV